MCCIFRHFRAIWQEIVNSFPVLSRTADKIRGKGAKNVIKQRCFGENVILDGKKDVFCFRFCIFQKWEKSSKFGC